MIGLDPEQRVYAVSQSLVKALEEIELDCDDLGVTVQYGDIKSCLEYMSSICYGKLTERDQDG